MLGQQASKQARPTLPECFPQIIYKYWRAGSCRQRQTQISVYICSNKKWAAQITHTVQSKNCYFLEAHTFSAVSLKTHWHRHKIADSIYTLTQTQDTVQWSQQTGRPLHGLADDGKRSESDGPLIGRDSSSIDSISLFASFSLCVRLPRIGGWRMTGSAVKCFSTSGEGVLYWWPEACFFLRSFFLCFFLSFVVDRPGIKAGGFSKIELSLRTSLKNRALGGAQKVSE